MFCFIVSLSFQSLQVSELVVKYDRAHLTVWGNASNQIVRKCYKEVRLYAASHYFGEMCVAIYKICCCEITEFHNNKGITCYQQAYRKSAKSVPYSSILNALLCGITIHLFVMFLKMFRPFEGVLEETLLSSYSIIILFGE